MHDILIVALFCQRRSRECVEGGCLHSKLLCKYVADNEYDPLFDAQLEAHDACKDMIDTMAKHLEALDFGTLTEEQRHSLSDETDNLMKTVKLKMEKV